MRRRRDRNRDSPPDTSILAIDPYPTLTAR